VNPIQHVLVATDFSQDSGRALELAREVALRFSAEIILLHVDETLASRSRRTRG
jgi:nucleotide-binding universal stress UspA family protein